MAAYFLDSSALLKFYVEEPGSDAVDALVNRLAPGDVAISRFATVEVVSGLVRRTRSGDIAEDDLQMALGFFDEDVEARFGVIELGGAVFSRARSLVGSHGLKAADAIQLASALFAAGDRKRDGGLTLVSSDLELNAAAEAEGLTVLNPAQV
jgi:hypothetical protein